MSCRCLLLYFFDLSFKDTQWWYIWVWKKCYGNVKQCKLTLLMSSKGCMASLISRASLIYRSWAAFIKWYSMVKGWNEDHGQWAQQTPSVLCSVQQAESKVFFKSFLSFVESLKIQRDIEFNCWRDTLNLGNGFQNMKKLVNKAWGLLLLWTHAKKSQHKMSNFDLKSCETWQQTWNDSARGRWRRWWCSEKAAKEVEEDEHVDDSQSYCCVLKWKPL